MYFVVSYRAIFTEKEQAIILNMLPKMVEAYVRRMDQMIQSSQTNINNFVWN